MSGDEDPPAASTKKRSAGLDERLYGAAWVRVREHGVDLFPVTPESAALGRPAPPAEPGVGGE